ncbi:MAG: hypothetical protein ABI333_23175 [bacterium]
MALLLTLAFGLSDPCISTWAEARYRAYGYDHIVHIRSRCKKAAVCDVSTDVSPKVQKVGVGAGAHVSVLTFKGSPARSFTPRVSCVFKR